MSKKEKEKEFLKQLTCLEEDPLKTTGVLLSNEIEYFATNYKLIYPFNTENLKPAAYELTVGDEYSLGGESHLLADEAGKNEVRIPPFEVAVIKTEEIINLPRFLIARWNIRVKWAYEGLLWVGGPQVDAGYVGHLFCPIYNLSDKEVTLKLGDAVAVMDFVKTTPFVEESKKHIYPRPPKRVSFSDYNPERLKSALYNEARKRMDGIEKRVNSFGTKLDTSIALTFTAISVLVAALSILVVKGEPDSTVIPVWVYLSVIFSIIAITAGIYAVTKVKIKKQDIIAVHVEDKIRKMERQIKILSISLGVALPATAVIIVIVVLYFAGHLAI